jgi:hypothetical protein
VIPVITLELDVSNLSDIKREVVDLALVRSINRVVDRLRTKAARVARQEVNFPASYLSPSGRRLWVEQRATRDNIDAKLRGQSRPTSRARFSTQKVGQKTRAGGVGVMVAPGQKRLIKRAFLIRLKNSNIGLAVRTNGGPPVGAYKPREIGKNLWLLYGPSVDQALLSASSGGGIFEDLRVETLNELEAEFTRQLKVIQNG